MPFPSSALLTNIGSGCLAQILQRCLFAVMTCSNATNRWWHLLDLRLAKFSIWQYLGNKQLRLNKKPIIIVSFFISFPSFPFLSFSLSHTFFFFSNQTKCLCFFFPMQMKG